MTMGFPYRDGGWWNSLAVEARAEGSDTWQLVSNLRIHPTYDFTDGRQQRRPFETYALTFDTTTVRAIRLIGQPGGIAQFTSLARLAVYERDMTRWNTLTLPEPPFPEVFRLVAPNIIWDMSESLAKLSGLTVGMPFMEFYLDARRYQQRWQRLRHNYEGKPDLWFLIGETIGWGQWAALNRPLPEEAGMPYRPYLRVRLHDTLATAVAPLVVEGQVLAELKTHPVILSDTFDWTWHKAFAAEHSIEWPQYEAAVARSITMSREQLEGAAELIGLMANTVAGLAHRLEGMNQVIDQPSYRRKALVRRAISIMEDRLDEAIDIAEVARAVGLSASYLSTMFTEETGTNPSEYLIRLRIERAKEYLTHSQLSVTEIAEALGYSRSYFTRLFTQHVGCPPGMYLAHHRAR
jgi:AraC-like DNA-binding protein